MFRRPVLVAVVLVGLLMVAVPFPAAGAADPYRTYVACGLTSHADPSHSCRKGADKGAFFKPRNATVDYKVCVKFPSGQKLCATGQHAKKGTLHVNPITSHAKGQHLVTWYVHGNKVGTWTFTVTD